MSIFVIADLHLSFEENKPMDIFGDNWENHAEKIKNNWIQQVKDNDYVFILGDFSWSTYLENTKKDFSFLNSLPGNKIILKGNHDYWWTTITSMKRFLRDNNFEKIDFLHNNSYCIEDKIIVGTRGWNLLDTEDDSKMIHRENARLQLSIKDAVEKFGRDKEIIAFFHYPPITKNVLIRNQENDFITTLKKYNIKRCYYGHLHGATHNDAVIGQVNGINYNLISADYLNFKLIKI